MSKRRIIILSVLAGFAVLIAAFCVWVSVERKRVESINCASAVRSICLAARIWAEDHGEFMPTNFISMSNEVGTPKILSCQAGRRVSDWSAFTPENCTYEIVSPGMRTDETNKVFMRCTIHGHLGYSDGTFSFDGVRRRPNLIERPNKITRPNAGGPRQLPTRTSLTARVGQFKRWASI